MTSLLQSSHAEFSRILQQQGVVAGLGYLNRRVEHRCTAVYRLEGMNVRNIHLFDREGAMLPDALGVVPLDDSFCQHAMKDGGFQTDNSTSDPRVATSPFHGVVVAYHAVPLLDRRSELFGTLCHFDFVERSLADQEFEFLQKAARILPSYL